MTERPFTPFANGHHSFALAKRPSAKWVAYSFSASAIDDQFKYNYQLHQNSLV
jgi:hypothetical protein